MLAAALTGMMLAAAPLPPTWPPNWNLTESTMIQPSGDDFFDKATTHPWGLVSLDWSVARSVWMRNGRNSTDCEAVSREGCRRLKASGKAARCFIYHNMELALEWEETQRRVMYNSSTAKYFLQYTDGKGNKNGTIYAENIAFGDQFFWDYTNPAAANFFVSSVVESVSYPEVDGTFTDDVGGLPEEHGSVVTRINMTAAQLKTLRSATTSTHEALVAALLKAGKFNWQAFGHGDGVGPAVSAHGCSQYMRTYCDPALQEQPMAMGVGEGINQSVAAFLVTRPPVGFLGWGWESDDRKWNDIFYLQPGVPTGHCEEREAGVFTRDWSAGTAALDCNSFTATLPFPSLRSH